MSGLSHLAVAGCPRWALLVLPQNVLISVLQRPLPQDWDDDNINDDFSQRLKAELAKQQQQQGQGA